MTDWTPNDWPSRETLLNDPFYASTDDMNDLRLIALAAHDLYEENQRLKAELGWIIDRARFADGAVVEIDKLKTQLAEAKRDTERLDWLEAIRDKSIWPDVRLDPELGAMDWYAAGGGRPTVREAIDVYRPSEHRKGE